MESTQLKPSREEFCGLAKQGNLIPVFTELIADCETPVSAFSKIDDGGYSFLLESAEHLDKGGRYSFVGSNPRVIFQSNGKKIRITENDVTREFETDGDPLTELQKVMDEYHPVAIVDLPRFTGGAVGYL